MTQSASPAAFWSALQGVLPPWSATMYAARTLLAVSLALYTAYALQLESPGSAATTVLIVANASQGALISKSVWRLVGSFLGAVAAVVLVAAFSQQPVLYVLGLAFWVGLCTFVASAFRYNRGYAAVLAGYTVALVALPAIAAPGRIFDLALARLSVVSIGVVSAGLVFMLTDPGTRATAFEPPLLRLISGTCRVVAEAFASGELAGPRAARGAMAADIASLDQVVEFTNAIEPVSAATPRSASGGRGIVRHAHRRLRVGIILCDLHHPDDRAAAALLRDSLIDIGAAEPGTKAATLAAQAARARAAIQAALETTQDLRALSGFDQALLLLHQLDEAIAALAALEAGKPRRKRLHLRGFVEWRTGLRNGIRAILAVTIAGLFWIISQWPTGGDLVLIICVLSALLTQTPSASAGSIAFAKGIIFVVLGAFFCNFAVLPRMSGFPLLLLGILPFILAGVLAQRIPRYAASATAYLALLFGTVSPTNPMVYDLAGALNAYVAFLVGGMFAVLAFRVLLPPNPVREAGAIADSLRQSTRRRPAGASLVFENMEHQKLLRMSQRLAALPGLRFDAVGEGVVLVLIGRHLEKIRDAAIDSSLPMAFRQEAARASALARRRLCTDPVTVSRDYAEIATHLGLRAGALPQRRLAACLREASMLIEFDTPFLRGEGVLTA